MFQYKLQCVSRYVFRSSEACLEVHTSRILWNKISWTGEEKHSWQADAGLKHNGAPMTAPCSGTWLDNELCPYQLVWWTMVTILQRIGNFTGSSKLHISWLKMHSNKVNKFIFKLTHKEPKSYRVVCQWDLKYTCSFKAGIYRHHCRSSQVLTFKPISLSLHTSATLW